MWVKAVEHPNRMSIAVEDLAEFGAEYTSDKIATSCQA